MKEVRKLLSAVKSHPGKKALGKALSISVLNQVVSSGANFALGIYLVRNLTPEEFGLYGIGFAISLFFAGIGNALFLTQMVVHTQDKVSEDRKPYAARMFISLVIFCLVFFLLIIFILIVDSFSFDLLAKYIYYIFAVVGASVAYLLKEFFIRHSYNYRMEIWALAVNISLLFSMIFFLSILHFAELSLSVEKALWVYALSHMVAAFCGYMLSNLPFRNNDFSLINNDMREAWIGGKWAVATHFIYYLRIRATTITSAVLLGPVGVAMLNAAQLFIAPAVMLTPALSQIFLPRAVQARVRGQRYLRNIGIAFTTLLLGAAIFYSVVILVAYDYLYPYIIGNRYESLYLILVVLCLNACILAVKNGIEIIFQAKNEFSKLMLANSLSMPITFAVVSYLTFMYGVLGCAAGAILGEFIFLFVLGLFRK